MPWVASSGSAVTLPRMIMIGSPPRRSAERCSPPAAFAGWLTRFVERPLDELRARELVSADDE